MSESLSKGVSVNGQKRKSGGLSEAPQSINISWRLPADRQTAACLFPQHKTSLFPKKAFIMKLAKDEMSKSSASQLTLRC